MSTLRLSQSEQLMHSAFIGEGHRGMIPAGPQSNLKETTCKQNNYQDTPELM